MAGIIPKASATALKVPTTAQLSVGEIAVNSFDGALYLRGNNGSDFVRQIGGSSYPLVRQNAWQGVSGLAATQDYEFDERIYRFATGSLQAITSWVQVPNSYTSGRQIVLRLGAYSPSSSNVFRLQTVSTLVRAGTDAVTTTTNQLTVNSGDVALATTNLLNKLFFNLTDASGLVNAVAVSPGDTLKVVLSRIAPGGTDDNADLRVLPNSGEIQF